MSLLAPLGVGILDAQQKPASHVAGEQLVKERGAGVAQVQVPGRAGCKACGNVHVIHEMNLRS